MTVATLLVACSEVLVRCRILVRTTGRALCTYLNQIKQPWL